VKSKGILRVCAMGSAPVVACGAGFLYFTTLLSG